MFLGEQNLGVAREAAPLLRIVAFSMPSLAILMVVSGALRGAGDTRWPLLVTVVGFLLIRIPAAYWLAWSELPWLGAVGWGLGVRGAWYAMLGDVVLRSGLVAWRFLHGGWMKVEV